MTAVSASPCTNTKCINVTKLLTYDGDNGILWYRGYPIEQLSEYATFIEVAYLVIYGELPTQKELEYFQKE